MASRGGGGSAACLSSARTAFFGVMHLAARKGGMPQWLVYAQMLLKVVQLLAFVFHEKASSSSWSPSLGWWRSITTLSNLSIFAALRSAAFHAVLYFAAVCIVLLLVGLLAFGVASFASTVTVLWPLRLLRLIGTLVAGVFYIPLLQILLSAFNCYTLAGDQYFCVSPALNTLQIVLSSVLGFVLLLSALLFSAVLFESHPLSVSDGARAHGRAQVIMLFVETVLVLTIETFSGQLTSWVLLIILGLAGAVWLATFLAFLPFYDYVANFIHIIGAAVCEWVRSAGTNGRGGGGGLLLLPLIATALDAFSLPPCT